MRSPASSGGGARALALGASLLALAVPLRSATLAERAAALDAPARGAAIALVAPLAVGHGEIVPAAGARVYPLIAAGAVCGLLVDGPARLRYRVDDRISVPVAERNLRRASSLEVERSKTELEVSEELSGAVVWGWGMMAEGQEAAAVAIAPGSSGKKVPAAAGDGLPRWAVEVLADRHFAPPSHDLVAEHANGGAGVRYAMLHGAHADLLLEVDPAAGEENLYLLRRAREVGSTFHEGVGPVTLASQPIGRSWWVHLPSSMLAEHETLRVENPGGDLLRLTSRARLRSRRPGVGLWQAQLVDRLWDGRGRPRRVTVTSVRVDGKPAEFLHQDDELLVAFARPLAAGATTEVEVAYEGDLAVRPAGDSYWVLGTWPWYPRQELGGELATMEIEVDVPEALTPFASGAQVSRTVEGGRRRLTTRLDVPLQFAVVAAGRYSIVEESRDGVTCRVATYALLNEQAARKLIAKFFSARRMLEGMLGEPYPFHDVSIVELSDWGFGQAPPGVIFFTREFFTAPMDSRRRLFFNNRDARFLHEVAHGWWGHVVKMSSGEESWLSEGFADYTAALALWQLKGGEGGGDYTFDEIVKDWARTANELAPGASLYLSQRLAFSDERNGDDFFRLRYAKGPLVIHALRLELQRQKGSVAEGDRYFLAFLRAFLQRDRYGWGTTRDLVATLDELTGGPWQPWFDRYVYGTEIPQLRE